MISMRRGTRQKVVAAAAVAVLLVGGAIAAVSATGQGGSSHHAGRSRAHDLATAAAYLGTSTAQLSQQLRSGKTLAQVAARAGAGKSPQGLIAALEAAKKTRLARATSRLPARVSAEVNRPGGPLGGAESAAVRLRLLFSGARHVGDAAAAYLGTSAATLQSELRAGKTLAQLADATAGKSKAGLVAAIVAAEQRAPQAARVAAHLSAKRLARREQRMTRRAERLVERKFTAVSVS